MKKQLTVALGLAVLATPAFASKARLQALGESVNGSQYISDNRNIFLNAAHLNSHKDLVTFETGASSQVVDGANSPRAEGGYFFSNGNMVYGVQLGEQSDTAHGLRAAGLARTTDALKAEVAERNAIDLFVGGDAGVKWGASVLYSSSEDKATTTTTDVKSQDSMRVRLGASQGNIDVFANVSVTNEVKLQNGNKFEGSAGYQLGGSYLLNAYTLFANYSSFAGDGTISGSKKEVSLSQTEIGVGRSHKLSDKTQLFTKVSYKMITTENDRLPAAATGARFAVKSLDENTLPVVVGLEHDAASWLTLRGSVTQNVFVNEIKGQKSVTDSSTTVVNAGATLKFGEFSVDGVIGNDAGAGPTGANTDSGTIRTDSLMSRVSMTYKF